MVQKLRRIALEVELVALSIGAVSQHKGGALHVEVSLTYALITYLVPYVYCCHLLFQFFLYRELSFRGQLQI
jgi:hypothetical protein